jgi:TonB-dependent receptor
MLIRSPRVHLFALFSIAALSLAPATSLVGQQAPAGPRGRIVGRVLEGSSGSGLTDVAIQVVGTGIGAMSGVDGRFTLTNVPAGTVTLLARRIGFAPKTVTGVQLAAGQTLEQNISLNPATVQLQTQTVTASRERGSVSDALDKQKRSTGIVTAITAEQIAKSPDGDAAQAVQRVSGVTVQDGKSVFVRGLGERYTTTSLNGARLPSPEPEKRYVPLDIFPTGLLQTITTTKTFTPDRNGDFGGAEVDIQTREFPARRAVTFSSTAGANLSAAGQSLQIAPRGGGEWFGLAGSERALPSALASAQAVSQLATQAQRNAAIGALRHVYTPLAQTGLPNGSISASIGGQDPVLGQRIGYLLSANYSATQEIRDGETEANPIASNTGVTQAAESFAGSSAALSTLWGGLANFSTMLGSKSRIMLNNTYTRTADNTARISTGAAQDYSGAQVERSTLRFVSREIRSNQLRGEHTTGRQNIDWSVTSSGVTRDEPDRTDVVRVRFGSGVGLLLPEEDADGGVRKTFGALSETNLVFSANYKIDFGSEAAPFSIRFGGQRRNTDRDASNRQFNLLLQTGALTVPQRGAAVETMFNTSTLAPTANVWRLQNVAQDGDYNAAERLTAGYLMGEWPVTDRLRLIAGARVEQANIDVATFLGNGTTANARLRNTDVLPSIVANYRVTETQSLRFSASQTLARPEYRELSPFQFLDVIGSAITSGNPNLRRTLIQNFDTKWEWYPTAGEVFSVGAFYKNFDAPIERLDVATGGRQLIRFENAGSARNFGVELEARKNLASLASALQGVTVFSNVTLMNSRIDIGTGSSANTNANRPMMGQAPYVVNAGGTWANLSGDVSATVLYSVVGRRISAAGTVPFPDIYEQPRNLLDLSLRAPLFNRLSLRVDARNLLDAPYRFTQGELTRQEWRVGRQFGIGLQVRN